MNWFIKVIFAMNLACRAIKIIKREMNAYGKESLACKCLGVDLVNAKAAAAASDCRYAAAGRLPVCYVEADFAYLV